MAGCPAPAIERQQVEGMNRHQLRATLDDVIEENDVCVPPLILCLTQPNSQERAREGGREGGSGCMQLRTRLPRAPIPTVAQGCTQHLIGTQWSYRYKEKYGRRLLGTNHNIDNSYGQTNLPGFTLIM